MPSNFDWAGRPERHNRRPLLKIIRAKADARIEATIVSPSVVGVWVHFRDGRTIGCLKEDCECQTQRVRTFWRGYLHVVDHADKRSRLLELPEDAVAAAALDAKELPVSGLRGMQLRVWRPSRRARGPVSAEVTGILEYGSMDRLPPARDVKEELLAIWSSGR